jgi:NADH-quinone oxidoreductase subunit N
MSPFLLAFLPELVLMTGALVLFFISLGESRSGQARWAALCTALATLGACVACIGSEAVLFDGAYRVDQFSQLLKCVFAFGFVVILVLSDDLPDIRREIQPEYYLFMALSVSGLIMLVSCVDLLTLVIALELSSFPLYFLVAMRRERDGHRIQMEAAVKYIMFGVAANGIMLFGMSYLFGLTGTTSLPVLVTKLQSVGFPMPAVVGLSMMFAGVLYKLAVFPFHFWTPDVYQGASNESTSLIASLPKIGAVAVLVRFVSIASPDNQSIVLLLTCLAAASMLYGNLLALAQKDLKRLFGFSGIAHAGYALVGFVALDAAGSAAAVYYIVAYLFMILACFVVICRVSKDGANVSVEDLAGLHRRSPLLAVTLGVGVFALAGIPPFAGFMGKLALLTAALSKGHLALVILTVLNAAVAVYYYLRVIREAWFRDPGDRPAIPIRGMTRVLCMVLIAGILLLGMVPARFMEAISQSLEQVDRPPVAETSLEVLPGSRSRLHQAEHESTARR